MAALAEDTLEGPTWGRRASKLGLALAGLLAVGLLAWWLKSLVSEPAAPKRQVARIAILPDTPPPPPPPPKEQPKPQTEAPKAEAPRNEPKPDPAPPQANDPIKMEGAAGDGPSAFSTGTVSNEYTGGTPVTTPAGGTGGVRSDRAQDRFYANSARQILRDEIERQLRSDAVTLTASFSVWLSADGAIERVELAPDTDPQYRADLQAAMEALQRSVRLPQPPVALTQPMRFRLTVRPQG